MKFLRGGGGVLAATLHLKNYHGDIKEDFILKMLHIVQQGYVGLSHTTIEV